MANIGLFAIQKIVPEYAGRICVCVYGEDAKRHKTEDISVNNGPT
jgi:hypothetical protein